ncbi:DUF2243 domain-containing protein [Gottfriedia acidiceleris]|uniref:DUF2243 domain-containing protein n=1 Tax=Gottfriedia acidiceleris TaxID=371036 RepID=UPI003000B444
MTTLENSTNYLHLNLWSGIFFGLGLVAFFDEAVFHQLLHWHHFYDKSTTNLGLISDGLFHAFSWFATIGSLFMFANLRRKKSLYIKRWIGGVLLGAGLFQLYDGTVQHKWMKLHQIRYNVDIMPYDLTWNITASIMILIGCILILKTRNKGGQFEG